MGLTRAVSFGMFFCLFFAGATGLLGQAPPGAPAWVELDRRTGEGEQCVVCRQPIHDDEVVELRYKGRTFHVATKMLGDFDASPDAYFSALQARSALFDERAHEGRRVSWGWVVFGCYVLLGLVFAALCGFLAVRRSLAPLPWFFAGLVGTIAALVVLLITPRGDPRSIVAGSSQPAPCTACGVGNHPCADTCGHCGAALAPTLESEVVRVVRPIGGAA